MVSIGSRIVGDVFIIDLRGTYERDARPQPAIHEMVKRALETGKKKILLNLAEGEIESDVGVGDIITSYTSTKKAGGEFKLSGLSREKIWKVKWWGADKIIEIHADEESALASFVKTP